MTIQSRLIQLQREPSAWVLQEFTHCPRGFHNWKVHRFCFVDFSDLYRLLEWASYRWTKLIPDNQRFYDKKNGIVFEAREANLLIELRMPNKINWKKEGF